MGERRFRFDVTATPGVYHVYDGGWFLGIVARRRHTYRTTYKGRMYGYDRSHTCWKAGDSYRRCYPTRDAAARALAAEGAPHGG